mgnify:CR=1 FL=1
MLLKVVHCYNDSSTVDVSGSPTLAVVLTANLAAANTVAICICTLGFEPGKVCRVRLLGLVGRVDLLASLLFISCSTTISAKVCCCSGGEPPAAAAGGAVSAMSFR